MATSIPAGAGKGRAVRVCMICISHILSISFNPSFVVSHHGMNDSLIWSSSELEQFIEQMKTCGSCGFLQRQSGGLPFPGHLLWVDRIAKSNGEANGKSTADESRAAHKTSITLYVSDRSQLSQNKLQKI